MQEARLLGVVIRDNSSQKSYTHYIVKQAYKRMIILYRLTDFSMPTEDLVEIYKIYIKSISESSAVVWHSSIIEVVRYSLERVQKLY